MDHVGLEREPIETRNAIDRDESAAQSLESRTAPEGAHFRTAEEDGMNQRAAAGVSREEMLNDAEAASGQLVRLVEQQHHVLPGSARLREILDHRVQEPLSRFGVAHHPGAELPSQREKELSAAQRRIRKVQNRRLFAKHPEKLHAEERLGVSRIADHLDDGLTVPECPDEALEDLAVGSLPEEELRARLQCKRQLS
jgi:hypothetical protein